MKLGERIRQVRKENGLTLDKFGMKIGIKKSSLSHIESGRSNPSDQTIRSICREFGVREEWLRTGEGEKNIQSQTFSLDEYVKQCGVTELEMEFIRLYLDLPAETRHAAIEYFRSGLSHIPVHETEEERHERHKREAREEAEEYYREVLEEKTREDALSAFDASEGDLA